MKKKQLLSLILVFLCNGLTVSAQDYSVKNRFTANVYANTSIPYSWMTYYVDASYGFFNQFDAGLYFGTDFIKDVDVQNYIIGMDMRYYLTPWFTKKIENLDFYLKASLGILFHSSEEHSSSYNNYNKMHYAFDFGARYYLLKRNGIMAEAGYSRFGGWNVNAGLCFRLRK